MWCETDIGCSSNYDRRLVLIDVAKPDRSNWKEVMSEKMMRDL